MWLVSCGFPQFGERERERERKEREREKRERENFTEVVVHSTGLVALAIHLQYISYMKRAEYCSPC